MALGVGNRIIDGKALHLERTPVEGISSNHRRYRLGLVFGLVLFDIFAAWLALFVRHSVGRSPAPTNWEHSGWIYVGLPAAVLTIFSYEGLYNLNNLTGGVSEYRRLIRGISLLIPVGLIALYIAGARSVDTGRIVAIWGILLVVFATERFVMRRISFLLKRSPKWRQRTLIIGASAEGCAVARQWASVPSGVEVIGFLDDKRPLGFDKSEQIDVLGRTSDLANIISEHQVDCLMFAAPEVLRQQLEVDDRILETLSHVEVFMSTGASELLNSATEIREEAFVPLIVLSTNRLSGLHSFLKTGLDFIITSLVLLLTGWLFPLIAILIRLDSPGPIIFRHRVIGLHRKPYYALKFRSMYMDGSNRLTEDQRIELKETMKLKDDPRITKVGAFLRKTSLDELPQLINVLLGQMSLVGPRMVVEHESEKFGRWQNMRATLKPGLTGLWQVSGRSDLPYEERVRLDIYYVRNYTIWLDLQILIQTIPAILARRGAY